MRIKQIFVPGLLLTLTLWVFAADAHGQRWYNEERDQNARAAAKLAEEITSKSSFEAQLRNLDKFAERDIEVYFKGAERQMELDINTLRTWKSVQKIVNRAAENLDSSTFIPAPKVKEIVADLSKECPLRTTPLGISVCKARAELEQLKAAHAKVGQANEALEEELRTRLEQIDTIESLVNQTKAFLSFDEQKSATIKELSAAFAGLAQSFATFNVRMQQINNRPKDDLKLLLQRVAVETLQLEVDHWKTVNEINIRRSAEEMDLNYVLGDVKIRLSQLEKCFGLTSQQLAEQEIRATFTAALNLNTCEIDNTQTAGQHISMTGEQMVTYVFETLHGVAALAARSNTPVKLAELRQAHELHRFSIRKSLVVARGYELLIRTGTDRLSRYYAGGLKPQQIAQLVYSAATLAIPGVIAGN